MRWSCSPSSGQGASVLQAGVTWRKAMTKLEGEEEYEALGKLDRLEAFDAYMRWAALRVPPAVIASMHWAFVQSAGVSCKL